MSEGKFLKLTWASVVVLLAILIPFLLLSLGFVVVLFFKKSKSFSHETESYLYHYYQVNPDTNTKSVGFTSIPTFLTEDEFISFEDDFGNHVLISNFDSTRYECLGTCICDEGIRRSHSATLSRSLIYLSVAASSYFAYEKAKLFFEDECQELFRDSCPSHAIKSEIDPEKCYKHGYPTIDTENKEILSNNYYCSGNCLPRKMKEDMKYAIEQNEEEFKRNKGFDQIDHMQKTADESGCQEMRLTGERSVSNIDPSAQSLEPQQAAEKIFMTTELDQFCEENSVKSVDIVMMDPTNQLGGATTMEYPMCVGHYDLLNPTVICIQGTHGDVTL